MADLKEFAEQLVNLSVKEVNELANILKDEYGIEPAAAAAGSCYGCWRTVVVMLDGGAEEKSSFDVILEVTRWSEASYREVGERA